MEETNQTLIEFDGITKVFPGVKALDRVSFSIRKNEIHALVGENGAGKSTLINIISGALQPDGGQMRIKGHSTVIPDPQVAYRLGISTVSQEFKLCGNLTVAGNIFLGREIRNRRGFLDWDAMNREASQLLETFGLSLDPRTLMSDLRVGQQQMVEIAKAFCRKADLFVLDEPTSALNQQETNALFKVLEKLKRDGVAIIYVSHHLEEIFQMADRVTVMRDGQFIKTLSIQETNVQEIISLMIGREVVDKTSQRGLDVPARRPYLKVEGLTKQKKFYDVDFQVSPGEVVSIFGLQGSGKSELVQAIYGMDRVEAGTIFVADKPVTIKSPADAVRHGIGYAPSDRRREGLVMLMTIQNNIALASLPQFSKNGWIDSKKLREVSAQYKTKIDIACSGINQQVSDLSGGNQQKVIVARLLAAKPRLLIMDEPTRGIDVGAKEEIYHLLHQLADEGLAVLIVSSELPEVQKVSDRVIVMQNGRINGRYNRGEASSEEILACAIGASVSVS